MCAWNETESALVVVVHMVHNKHPGQKVPHCIRQLGRNDNQM